MTEHVRVNPIRCDAHGMCAELLPERITLDDWGYPIVDDRPLNTQELELARMAVDACPVFALALEARSAVRTRAPKRSALRRS
jgi:ferredoxin